MKSPIKLVVSGVNLEILEKKPRVRFERMPVTKVHGTLNTYTVDKEKVKRIMRYLLAEGFIPPPEKDNAA